MPVADLGENEFNRKNPIGSGPFKFVEWKKGEYVKLEANDDYFGGRPYLDTVTVKTIPDSNAAVAQLKAGILISSLCRAQILIRLKRLEM